MPVTRLIIEATLNASQANAASAQLNAQMEKFGATGERAGAQASRGIDAVSLSIKQVQSRLSSLQQVLGPMSEAINLGLTVPITLFAKAAFDAYKNLDNIQRGITSLLNNQNEAVRQISEIRVLAKNPGLDFESAASGFRRLVSAGLEVPLATSALKEFGNALALIGGSSEDLAGVNLALQQIASKTKVSAEEVNQIAERIPSVRRLIIQAYGTADTEELQRRGVRPLDFIRQIVEQAKTLPRATSGIANEMKNFTDEIKRNLQVVGGDIAQVFTPAMKALTEAVSSAGKAFRELDPETRRTVVVTTLLISTMGPAVFILNQLRSVLTALITSWRLYRDAVVAASTAQAAASAGPGVSKVINSGVASMYGERAGTVFTSAAPTAARAVSLGTVGAAVGIGAAAAAFGALLLRYKQVDDTTINQKNSLDALNQKFGLLAPTLDTVKVGNDLLAGSMDAVSKRMQKIRTDIEDNARAAANFYKVVDVGVDMPTHGNRRQVLRAVSPKEGLLRGLSTGTLNITPPTKEDIPDPNAAKRAELMRDLMDSLIKQRAETAIVGGDMGEMAAYNMRRVQSLSSMRERNAAVWSSKAEGLFNSETAEGRREIFFRQRNQLFKERNKLAAEAIDLIEKEGEAARKLYGDQYLDSIKQANEQERDRLQIAAKRLEMMYDIDQRRADIGKTQAIGMAELGEGSDVRSKVATEERKLAIEREYIAKSLQIQLKKVEVQYNAEIMMAEAKGERLLAADLRAKLAIAQDELRSKSQLDEEEAVTNARVRQYQIQRDAAVKVFNSIKDGAGRIFDSLLLKTESFGQAIKNIFKTALLTPLREFAATWTAMLLTGGSGANGRSAGGSAQQGLFNRIFGGFGGFGTSSTSSAGDGGGGGGIFGGLFGGGMRTPISTGINGGTIYSDGTSTMGTGSARGFGGKLGLAGIGSGFKGWLTSLGNIGYGPKGGDFGGEVSGSYRGVGGLKGGAMLAGGSILAMDGLRRGGVTGMLETTAGGALIGAKFGGPIGAAIGAAVGFGAGLIRLFIKGATEKTVEKIKSLYGITVEKNYASSAIVPIIKQQFGGNIDVGIRSPQVRELLELYAMSTGQPFKSVMNPNTPRPVSYSQVGGQLYSNPQVVNGSMLSNMDLIRPGSAGGSVVIKLDGPATTDLLSGVAAQAVVDNPRAVSDSLGNAMLSSVGRRQLSAALNSPGLVTA